MIVAPVPEELDRLRAQALASRTRQQIMQFALAADRAVAVAELTRHVGGSHTGVRKHLARLVGARLLVEERERQGGRGRPRLVYRIDPAAGRPAGESRSYEELAVMLADALAAGGDVRAAGRRAGRAVSSGGQAAPDPVDIMAAEMSRQGFAPERRRRDDGRVELVLGRCPYATAAAAHPAAVCELHRGMAEGVAEAVGGMVVDDLVVADPRAAGCRLVLTPG